jgi:hypothetical protein
LATKVTGPGVGVQGGVGGPPEASQGSGSPDGIAGKPGPGGAEGPDKAGGATAGRSFAETLAAGRAAPGVAPSAAQTQVGGPDALTSDIATDLKAGKVDAKTALDRVVERVLDRQLGADAPVALRDQVREALRDTIGGDPFLADRLRGLS